MSGNHEHRERRHKILLAHAGAGPFRKSPPLERDGGGRRIVEFDELVARVRSANLHLRNDDVVTMRRACHWNSKEGVREHDHHHNAPTAQSEHTKLPH